MAPPELTPGDVLRTRRDVRFRHLPPDCVVVRQEASEVLVLNSLGGRVLDLVDGRRTVEALIQQVCDEHDAISAAQVRSDVRAFLDSLLEAGVVERAAA